LGIISISNIEEAKEDRSNEASFRAKGIYVKKLGWGTFCPFGNRYGVHGIRKLIIAQKKERAVNSLLNSYNIEEIPKR